MFSRVGGRRDWPPEKDAPPGCLESKRIPLEEMGKGFSEPVGPKSLG